MFTSVLLFLAVVMSELNLDGSSISEKTSSYGIIHPNTRIVFEKKQVSAQSSIDVAKLWCLRRKG